MGTVTKYIEVAASADEVWEAVRDYGAVHERVVPGFVVETKLEGSDRVVTFVTGAVARERLVALDHERRRLAYAVVESPLGFTHHQASVEIWPLTSATSRDGAEDGCTIVWTSDFLPEDPGAIVEAMMGEGAAAMARTFGPRPL
jgi:polyketide cyclase/dehydrase/lipid transport protein